VKYICKKKAKKKQVDYGIRRHTVPGATNDYQPQLCVYPPLVQRPEKKVTKEQRVVFRHQNIAKTRELLIFRLQKFCLQPKEK
jgi:hypothetical protein